MCLPHCEDSPSLWGQTTNTLTWFKVRVKFQVMVGVGLQEMSCKSDGNTTLCVHRG